jgi:hypothetical protein
MHSGSPSDAETEPGSAGAAALAKVIRLRPIRTLVVSCDRDYRERAMTVLAELGPVSFAFTSLGDAGDIVCLVQDEHPDVVVLDATGGEAAARLVIAALADAAPRAGVLVVCHHCTDAARDLQALPKWGWTQDLRAGVELAYREGNPMSSGTLSSLRRRPAWQRMAGPLLRR